MKIEFPQIHSFPEKMNPIEHSQRLKLTIIRMKTLFTKKNIKINSDSFIPNNDVDFGKATFEIENHIGNLISEYVKVNEVELASFFLNPNFVLLYKIRIHESK